MFDPYHKWLGIPPDDQPPNHYRLLGINPFESDPDVIANAADQRMAHVKRFESGRHSALSQDLLNQLAQAKICLLNPLKKHEHDEHLRRQTPGPGVQVVGRVWRIRWPQWQTLWQSDRFWQMVSTAALVLMLLAACTVLARARGRSLAQAPATPPRLPTNIASAPAPSITASSTVSAPIRARETAPAAPPDEAAAPLPAVPVLPESPPPQRVAPHTKADAAPPTGPKVARESLPSAPQPMAFPVPIEKPSAPIYLDDLKELSASVGWGQLGKHGQTGYPADDDYGGRGLCRGSLPSHMLSLHPPERGTAFVSYALEAEYRLLRASVGILEVERAKLAARSLGPFFTGQAFSPLTFRVVGNGKVLWESRPIRRCGDWQECSVALEGVRLLELQVDCPGPKTFAWAAWLDPLLER